MPTRSAALLVTLVLSTMPLPAAAQDPGDAVVLRAARLLDVRSGEVLDDAWIKVVGERIEEVGQGDSPAGRTVDLGDVTLLPGLIDAHTHLASQIDASSFTRAVTDTESYTALRAAHFGRETLMAGFTTVRDFGGDATVALRHAVEEGLVLGPRIVPSRNALGITGGHCDVTGFKPGVLEGGPRDGVADGIAEVLEAVRYQIKHGARVIKTCATAGVLSFEGPVGAQQYSDAELVAMVEEAARHGIKVAAHAHGTEGIRAAVRAGVASIEHGSELDDETIELMKERGTYLVPTTYLVEAIDLDALPPVIRAKAESILPVAVRSLRRAIAAGVPIAFGTDAGVYPHGDNAREIAALVERGMTPLQAVQAATLNAADLLDVDDRAVLEAGRLADLIAVPGDPLRDPTMLQDVRFVMLGGKIVKGRGGPRPQRAASSNSGSVTSR